jgi:hypothetical protein
VVIVRAAVCVALAFAGASSFAASKPLAPGANDPVQQNLADTKQNENKLTAIQRGTDASPTVVKLLPPDVSEEEVAHKDYERHEKPMLDRWLTWGTVALALITAVLSYFTYRLWSDARLAARESAKDTQASLAISKQAADAATLSAEVARRALVITQRASVHPNFYHVDGNIGEDGSVVEWRIGVRFENSGQTRAERLSAGSILQEVAYGQPPPAFDFTTPGARIGLGRGAHITAVGKNSKDRLSRERANRILNGEIDVYLCGIARYYDVFEGTQERVTKVCMKLTVEDPLLKRANPFGFLAYDDYNDAT